MSKKDDSAAAIVCAQVFVAASFVIGATAGVVPEWWACFVLAWVWLGIATLSRNGKL